MPDYSKAVAYKIQCLDEDIKEIYVGSSCNFTRRKCEHKSDCNTEHSKKYNYKVYQFIRDNGGWDNWRIVPIEKIKCIDKIEMLIEETKIIEREKATLNAKKAHSTKEEKKEYYDEYRKTYNPKYYEENKEQILEQSKIYRDENKEKTKESRKEKVLCECGKEIVKNRKARHIKSQYHIDRTVPPTNS